MEILTLSHICRTIPRRKPDAQKGDFGRVLCITGSRNMPGACYLSTQAALRSGAGLVTVATAPENPLRLAAALPEAMWLSMQTDADGFLLDLPNHEQLSPRIRSAAAVLLGCGLGTTSETQALVRWILSEASCPVVVDADGLNCIAGCIDIERMQRSDWILTPHPGEMARLTGRTIAEIQENRRETAAAYAKTHSATLVLKGAGTLIAQKDRLCQNPTGNPGMSRGGSGDALAGIIAALCAQGISPWDAACAGVYLHGFAGDLAAQQLSQQAMLPRDLLNCLPAAFLKLEQERDKTV